MNKNSLIKKSIFKYLPLILFYLTTITLPLTLTIYPIFKISKHFSVKFVTDLFFLTSTITSTITLPNPNPKFLKFKDAARYSR